MESELEVMNYSETVTKEIVGQKSIFSNYAFILLRTFFISGVSFISTVLIYRVLSVKSIGQAAIYVAVLNGITGLFLIWPVNGLMQFGRVEYDQKKRLEETFASTLAPMVMLFVMSTAVCFFLKNTLMGYLGLPNEWLWLFIMNMLFIMLNKILNQVFYVTASIPLLSILDLLEHLLMLIFLVYFWVTVGTIPITTYPVIM